MAYLSIAPLENTVYEDLEEEPRCVLVCDNGQIELRKRVLTLHSKFWKETLSDGDEVEHYSMPSLTVEEVGRIRDLLWSGHLFLPAEEASKFFLCLDQMEIHIKLMTEGVPRINAPHPELLPSNSSTQMTSEKSSLSSQAVEIGLATSSAITSPEHTAPNQDSLPVEPARTRTVKPTVTPPLPIPSDIMQSTNTGRYCKICKRHFKSKKHVYVHYPGTYCCKHCPKIYSRSDNLTFHVKRVHPNLLL